MKMRAVAAGLAVALAAAACGEVGAAERDVDRIDRALADHPDEAVAEVGAGFDAFGFDLLAALRADSAEPNLVLSPLSAGAALSLVLAGAGGDTAAELAAALGIDADAPADGRVGALLLALADADGVDLTLANAVWTRPDYPLTDEFRAAAGAALGASIDELDLADAEAVAEIDRWAAEHTDGLVEEITDALAVPDPLVVAVLANATHFAGVWTDEFDHDDTRPGPFTRDDGSTVTAELMRADDMEVAVAVDPDAAVVLARLAYGDDQRFGFEVLLPSDDTPISDVLDHVDAARWRALSEQAMTETGLRVVLPRFAAASDHDLTEPLQALGVDRAFGNGHDFTPMSPDNPWLGTVAQKAVIEVDESGTEAAAVTAAEMLDSAPLVTEVIVNRSFAFAVRDTTTGASLFLGVIDDPTA